MLNLRLTCQQHSRTSLVVVVGGCLSAPCPILSSLHLALYSPSVFLFTPAAKGDTKTEVIKQTDSLVYQRKERNVNQCEFPVPFTADKAEQQVASSVPVQEKACVVVSPLAHTLFCEIL